jgi:hypothetical protein
VKKEKKKEEKEKAETSLKLKTELTVENCNISNLPKVRGKIYSVI